jgi:hypothetical protein
MPLKPGTHCANCTRIVILSAAKDLSGYFMQHQDIKRARILPARTHDTTTAPAGLLLRA